jgi:hypothetical protein
MDELEQQLQQLAAALAEHRQVKADLGHAATELKALELLHRIHGLKKKNKGAPDVSHKLAILMADKDNISER